MVIPINENCLSELATHTQYFELEGKKFAGHKSSNLVQISSSPLMLTFNEFVELNHALRLKRVKHFSLNSGSR